LIVRIAEHSDRQAFVKLWKEYLEEQHQDLGHHVLPSKENVLEFTRLFEAYTAGSLWGVCVLMSPAEGEEPVGVCMMGENFPGGVHLKTAWGKVAEYWGIYVKKEYRRAGAARAVAKPCFELAKSLGFNRAITSMLVDDPIADEKMQIINEDTSWDVKPGMVVYVSEDLQSMVED